MKGNTYPIRAIRDPESGEIGFYVSMGRLAEGGEKVIKDIVHVSNGQIKLLVKASPKKLEVGERRRTDAELAVIQEGRDRIAAEAAVSKSLRDAGVPNVLKIWEVSYPKGGAAKRAYLMERCEGDLGDVVEPAIEGELVKEEALKLILPMFLQLLKALQGMHGEGLVHRDLKSTNVLIRGDGIRLADFGYIGKKGEPARLRGTPGFIAPELYASGAVVSSASDMWSFGVLLFYGVSGEIPLWDSPQQAISSLRSDNEERVRKTIEILKPEMLRFLEQLMEGEKAQIATMGLEEGEVARRQKEIEARYTERMRKIAESSSPEPILKEQYEDFYAMLDSFRKYLETAEDGVRKPIYALIFKLLGPVEQRPSAEEAYDELYAILSQAGMVPKEG